MYQRGLTEEDFPKHAYMKSASEFNSAKIEDYLGVVQADIDMLPDFSESSKIVQVLEGIQPVSFRSMIHSKYPHIVSMADVKGAIAIIRGASQKEQKAIDDRKAGWGNHCRGPSNTTKQRENEKKSGKSEIGGPYARGMGCTNCGGDHHISMCTSRCTNALHLIAARFHRSVLTIWRGSPNATLERKFLLKLIMQGHPIMRNLRKD